MTPVYLYSESYERNGNNIYTLNKWTEDVTKVPDVNDPNKVMARDALVVKFASPITVLVTSPSGKRAGFDPTIQSLVFDFPMAISNAGDEPYEVLIPNPEQGQYTYQVTGTASGTYTMNVHSIDNSGVGSSPTIITGIAVPGVTDTYIILNPRDGSQPVVTLIYNFTGFFQPIVNLPASNSVKAGSAVPVKFSLSGNQGLDIFAANYPVSQKINCDSNAPIDGIEETTKAGSSSLSYNATIDQYNYVWKTDKTWAGSCRQLSVLLKDGTYHNASFKFLK